MYSRYFCNDIENVENYEKARADNFKGWVCHHRLETHNSDGERRLIDIKSTELAALDMYWNRPANELIFLTVREHNTLHNSSIEKRRKMSEARKGMPGYWKGKTGPMKGKHHSMEARKRMSEAAKGKHIQPRSEETRKRISIAKKGNQNAKGNQNVKGRHYYNNGKINVMRFECPEGFVPGRLI